jgi:CRISPR-associated endonuclease/helicase Cas3
MRYKIWPDYLDDVLAKSVDRGGETLARHTADVLEKLAALRDLRPDLPTLAGMPSLWRVLHWACLFHDFGKAARGFQTMLASNGKERWPERHEVLSLLAFDWIAENFTAREQTIIVAAIASHHRDLPEIERKYARVDPDPLAPLAQELDDVILGRLWQWVSECATTWGTQLGFLRANEPPIALMPREQAIANALSSGATIIRRWLDVYGDWVREVEETPDDSLARVCAALVRGLTTSADHLASAHVRHLESPPQMAWESLAKRILAEGETAYDHQQDSALRSGRNVMLASPTGSGKTEAALYWALGDGSQPVPRLFYALPYQASMNAMYDRLRDQEKGFGDRVVGLQHGRATQALYTRMMTDELGPKGTQARVAWAQDMTGMHARPVTVFSPYQMLKALFQIRGYEALLTDYAQAAFVFDEIHAYEPERLALILPLIRYLREHYRARFFVMSATFPAIIRELLADALGIAASEVVTASPGLYERFRRHRLHLLDGDLMGAGVQLALRDYRNGKSVLVCANTIQRARDIAAALRNELPKGAVELIHGRFAVRDRVQREQEILQRCREGERNPVILVATQVVEVSLNIDLDTIYSDPASLDALLQRFGRVNRRNKKAICPVCVFTQPTDGQGVYGRSKDPEMNGRIVRVTLAELARHDGEVIDEAKTGAWLDEIYGDERIRATWTAAYRSMLLQTEQLLRGLSAFKSDPMREEQFEGLFDGVDVLPAYYEAEYLKAMTEGRFVDASGFFVSISERNYRILANQGFVREIETLEGERTRRRWMVMLPYDERSGLSLDRRELGE